MDRSPIFVVGVPRSGTTLIASMLASHPRIAISPETGLFPSIIPLLSGTPTVDDVVDYLLRHPRWPDFQISADVLRARLAGKEPFTLGVVLKTFYRCMPDLSEKPRWGDKTPRHAGYLPELSTVWPDAAFIHVIRDPRSVVTSQVRMPWGPNTIEDATRRWLALLTRCRSAGRSVRRYTEIKYESLLNSPETELRRLCEFISEGFDSDMLEFHRHDGGKRLAAMTQNPRYPHRESYHANIARPLDPSIADRWKHHLTPVDLATVHAIAGELLVELGYPSSDAVDIT